MREEHEKELKHARSDARREFSELRYENKDKVEQEIRAEMMSRLE